MSAAFTRTPSECDLRADLLLAGVMFVGGILSAALSAIAEVYADEQAPLWQALVYVTIVTAPVALRRRFPGTVAVVVTLAYFGAVTLRIPELYVGSIAMFATLYTVGAWMNDRRRAVIVRVAIIVGMLVWLLVATYRGAIDEANEADVAAGLFSPYVAFMMLQLLVNLLYFGGAYYFGERSWSAARERDTLERRTAELEAERERNAAQAVALDRVRIARELHDVVAHHVSVMGVQAGAARLMVDQDPAEARRILGGIEAGARDAIRDFRQLLETLRAPGGEVEELPSTVQLGDIARLAESASDAGLPTTYTVVGDPVVGDPVVVPDVVAINLYRIAQEALTNARRHAGPGARADVRVRYLPDAVEVEVVNTGRTITVLRPGLGQLGMRERAHASGGTIELEPRPQGGFRVRATLPLIPAREEQPA